MTPRNILPTFPQPNTMSQTNPQTPIHSYNSSNSRNSGSSTTTGQEIERQLWLEKNLTLKDSHFLNVHRRTFVYFRHRHTIVDYSVLNSSLHVDPCTMYISFAFKRRSLNFLSFLRHQRLPSLQPPRQCRCPRWSLQILSFTSTQFRSQLPFPHQTSSSRGYGSYPAVKHGTPLGTTCGVFGHLSKIDERMLRARSLVAKLLVHPAQRLLFPSIAIVRVGTTLTPTLSSATSRVSSSSGPSPTLHPCERFSCISEFELRRPKSHMEFFNRTVCATISSIAPRNVRSIILTSELPHKGARTSPAG